MCYTIEEIKDKTIPIAKKHGISRMCLFGSYAREEANDDSDVDLYVDKGKNKLTTDTVQAISTALVTVAGGLTGDRATGACTAQMGTGWYR